MANSVDETDASYISKLVMNGTGYTIKDEWARAEIDEVKSAVTGGVHFRGVSSTEIEDNESLKVITLSGGGTVAVADQKDGDIFIYNNGTKNLEFIVSGGKYSEFGSTGELGSFAYANQGAGTATVDISSAITLDSYTPQVSKGTLGVTYGVEAVTFDYDTATASGTFSPANITIAPSTVTFTPTKGSFTALKNVSYDSSTATLSISNGTSDEFWKSATGQAAGQTVSQDTDQPISITYDKFIASNTEVPQAVNISLVGDLTVTASAPTATITNPTITVTVTPVA